MGRRSVKSAALAGAAYIVGQWAGFNARGISYMYVTAPHPAWSIASSLASLGVRWCRVFVALYAKAALGLLQSLYATKQKKE